jgi:hypothetical protein
MKEIFDISKYEIKPSDKISRDEVIVLCKSGHGWADLMSLGNISTIIGKAKGRKTFFTTLLIAGIITNREVQIKSAFKGDIVLFDTEQGKYHVWKVARRIELMVGMYPENLRIFGLRPLNTQERLTQIENYLYQHEPKLVFIDGIRDLVTDINSAEQATDIVGRMMKWSYERECHICAVLHQNKADENARGHIGSEIVNKSESVISVNKMKDKTYSLVRSEYTRGEEMTEFKFSIENGLPVIDYTEMENYYEPEKEEVPF